MAVQRASVSAPCFRFDAGAHLYRHVETATEIPHITGMLMRAGLVDDAFYTAESCERGHIVHELTAKFDLDAIRPEDIDASAYRGWLLAHIAATHVVRPTWEWIEVPRVHRQYGFAGRADRVGQVFKATSVAEIKSGPPAKSHLVQTALQAILVSDDVHLPPELIRRYGWYLQGNGKWTIEEHKDRRDLDEARRIAKQYGVGPL